ncbi:MAG: DNA repair protein RadC [Pseudomonadota bacterium]
MQPLRQTPLRGADIELLSSLLAPELGAVSARQLAFSTLARAGNLRALLAEPPEQLARWPGWSQARADALAAVRGIAVRQFEEKLARGSALTSPGDTLAFLRAHLMDRRREVFCGLFLDTRHRIMAWEELFHGSIDGACVYPRVVAEKALLIGAAALIVAHNHPSGVSEPSLADQAITRRLKEALGLLEIRLLDHFVIGDGEPVSMAARGML